MFILVSDSTKAALSMLESYFKQTKTDTVPIEEKIYGIDDLFNGYIALTVIDRFLLGIVDLNDKELANDYLAQFADYVIQLHR